MFKKWAIVFLAAGELSSLAWGSFASKGRVVLSASATIGASSAFTITVSTLPQTAFFGKNVVIPVMVSSSSGAINTQNLNVSIVYQMVDTSGNTIGAPINVPIVFPASTPLVLGGRAGAPSTAVKSLSGFAIIPAADIAPIQHGGQLKYLFVAQQGATSTMQRNTGAAPAPANITGLPNLNPLSPFTTTITDQLCIGVDPSQAAVLAIPDLFVHDGQTSVSLAPHAVLSPGTLCISQPDPSTIPPGPGGAPTVVYSMALNNTSLVQPIQLVLSYPADVSGKVLNSNISPTALAIYWLGPENSPSSFQSWRLLSDSSVDTTLHTVTSTTGHLSTFALFAAGAPGTVDLRPPERIITPNGDHINDYAIFGFGIDEIRIFDTRGRRVRTISAPTPIAECAGSACWNWDGRDDSGDIVASGVYIYQYSASGDRVSGVIGVAK